MKRHAWILLALVAGCSAAAEIMLAFDAKHIDSLPHDLGFVEVFRVTSVAREVEIAGLSFTLDGAPVRVGWTNASATLAPGDTFRFVADAFDVPRVLEALAPSGAREWHAEYRGGAGDDTA